MVRSDNECISRAIWWAEKHGYELPPIEEAMFKGKDADPLRASLKLWACGLLMSQDFAKAIFGEEEVDEYGQSVVGIQVWAKQVAVEHNGKLYDVPYDQYEMAFYKMPLVDMWDKEQAVPTTLVKPEITRIKLENLYGTIPAQTHRIHGVRVLGAIPAWQWHLQKMVICSNPFDYVDKYIEKAMAKPWKKKV